MDWIEARIYLFASIFLLLVSTAFSNADGSSRIDWAPLFPPGANVPVYSLKAEHINITSVSAVRLPWQNVFVRDVLAEAVHDSRVVCREMLYGPTICADSFRSAPIPLYPAITISVEEEGYFNLWKVNELRASVDDNLVVAAIDIETETASDVALGIGCDKAFFACLNGKCIWGRIGNDAFRPCSELLSLGLAPGRNRLVVGFESRERKIRHSYFAKAWQSKLELFRSPRSARSASWENHNSLVDSPLVSDISDLRIRRPPPFCNQAILKRLDGVEIAHGRVGPDGAINWENIPSSLPLVALLGLDDSEWEPVGFTNGKPFESLLASVPSVVPCTRQSAWAYRLKHLLKPEFASLRTQREWSQKLVDALAGTTDPSALKHSIQLGVYNSAIDRSTQYFMYYVPRNTEPARGRPLVVFLPTVANPVRPFLESSVIANQYEFQNWCSLADRYGLNLLWPGYNEVDYGGDITMTALGECLRAYSQQLGTEIKGVHLFASCSAGVAAVRYASRCPSIEGVLLYSPILVRPTQRFTPGISYPRNFVIPKASDEFTSMEETVKGLRNTGECILLFDNGIPGHGVKEESDEFLRLAGQNGLHVKELHCEEKHEIVFGERMKYRLDLMLRTMAHQEATIGALQASQPLQLTIKRALLEGFQIDNMGSSLSDWLTSWQSEYLVWRGAELPVQSDPQARTKVKFIWLSLEEVNELCVNGGYKGDGLREGEYCGIILSDTQKTHNVVTVFKTSGSTHRAPNIDPLIDCECRGLLCKWVGDDWQVVKFW